MASPRWLKAARELRSNPTRTLLVVLSIAVGVIAVGMVAGAYAVITRELPAGYAEVNPASARLYTDPFGSDLLRVIGNMPEVEAVAGRRYVTMRLQVAPDRWRDIDVFALPNYNAIEVGKIWPQRGAWPPPARTLLMERAAMGLIGARIGDRVTILAPNGTQRTLPISGVVHDLNQPSARFVNRLYGYVTPETMQWFGIEEDFNELSFVVAGDKTDRAAVAAAAAEVRSKVEKSGRSVYWMTIPEPGKHPAERFIAPMALILGFLGILSVLLSALLVVNTLSALLSQQIRQIGVMKAIGGRSRQITGIYLAMVLALGLMALAVSIPLSLLAVRFLVGLIARLINFDVASFAPPPAVLLLQAVASLCVPLAAAWVPVRQGVRRTVREAMTYYGIGEGREGTRLTDRLLSRVRGVSRPLLLSLRNTFRRKMRLVLTLTSLGLASTIFVVVGSVQASLSTTLDDAMQYWQYDVGVNFIRPYRVEEVEKLALQVPGVLQAESWGYQAARRLRPDDTYSDNLIVIAPPAQTTLLQPTVLAGRWLLPEDENAVVITTDLLREEPDLRVGQTIELLIDGRKSSWLIVGLMRGVLSGPTLYANYPYFSRATRSVDRSSSVQVVADRHDPAYVRQLANRLEDHFEANSVRVAATSTVDDLRQLAIAQFRVIVLFLLLMAVALALVGALGLMGTMSINVLERTKEIGMMRAIGATGKTVRRMVIFEGSLIGVLSWVLGALIAVPVSQALSRAVGLSFLQAPLSYSFSTVGAASWLVAVVVLAAVASLWPARNAARLSVRDVLAYE